MHKFIRNSSAAVPHRKSACAVKASGFSLIELLVVIAIVALLIGILLPALAAARFQARVTTCAGQLQQFGVALFAYAADNRDALLHGPQTPSPPNYVNFADFSAAPDLLATNQLFAQGINAHVGLGKLLRDRYLASDTSAFCPGDDTADPVEELDRLRAGGEDAYASYMYRQRDEMFTPQGQPLQRPRIDLLGVNGSQAPVQALAFDLNFLSLAFGPAFRRSNHEHRVVNVLNAAGDVATLSNASSATVDGRFVIPQTTTFPSLVPNIDSMLQALDEPDQP